MHFVARVLSRLAWLVWTCLLFGTSVAGGAAHSVERSRDGGAPGNHAVAWGAFQAAHDWRPALTPVRHHIDDGPADDADAVDPAALPPLGLALTSPARDPARSSVPVSCTVAGLPSFRLLGPLGSRPPPFSL